MLTKQQVDDFVKAMTVGMNQGWITIPQSCVGLGVKEIANALHEHGKGLVKAVKVDASAYGRDYIGELNKREPLKDFVQPGSASEMPERPTQTRFEVLTEEKIRALEEYADLQKLIDTEIVGRVAQLEKKVKRLKSRVKELEQNQENQRV